MGELEDQIIKLVTNAGNAKVQDSFQRTAKTQNLALSNSIKDIAFQLLPGLETYVQVIQKTAKIVRPVIKQIAEQYQKNILPVMEDFAKQATLYYKAYEKYKGEIFPEDLKQYMWLLPPEMYQDKNSPLFDLPSTVLMAQSHWETKDDKEKIQKIIDAEIIKALVDNKYLLFEQLIDKWYINDALFIKDRIKILKDCLKVIRKFGKNASANVVLPTLISQIEGIWLDLLNNKGINIDEYFVPKNGKPRKIYMGEQKEELKKLIDEKEKYHLVAFELLVNRLFCDSNDMDGDFEFRRHKIMHGRDANYGNIASVIKAFFMLDYLYRIDA